MLLGLTLGATLYGLALLYALELPFLRGTGMPFIQGRYLLLIYPLQALAIVIGLRALSRRFQLPLDGAWSFVAMLAVINGAAIAQTFVRYDA